MQRWRCACWVGALLVASGAFSAGCRAGKDRVEYDNFNRIQPYRSTAMEVERILGPPDHKLGELWIYSRAKGRRMVKIEIGEDGIVQRKEWIDADRGVWEDSDSPPQ